MAHEPRDPATARRVPQAAQGRMDSRPAIAPAMCQMEAPNLGEQGADCAALRGHPYLGEAREENKPYAYNSRRTTRAAQRKMPMTLENRAAPTCAPLQRQLAIYAILKNAKYEIAYRWKRSPPVSTSSSYNAPQDDRKLKCRRVLRLAKYPLDLSRMFLLVNPTKLCEEWHLFSRAEAMLGLGASPEKPANVSLSESRQCPLLAPSGARAFSELKESYGIPKWARF